MRGGLTLSDEIRAPTMNRFIEFLGKQTQKIVKDRLTEERRNLQKVKGMYDDIDGFRDDVPIIDKAIMGDVLVEVLQNEIVQKLDLALEKMMKNGYNNNDGSSKTRKKSMKEQKLEADEDTEEYDDDYDGNDLDD
jgi:type II secretory pathway component GspD/PulD (secretin)